MMAEKSQDALVKDLQSVLDNGRLPKSSRVYGRRLMRRISMPVRVSVLGLPGTGKADVLNCLAGRRLSALDLQIPTVSVSHSDKIRAALTGQDGAVQVSDNLNFSDIASDTVASARLELPAPQIAEIELTRMQIDPKAEDLRARIDWVVARSDILLWCGGAFGEAEQAIWELVPDNLKDHAYFVLTDVDRFRDPQQLTAHIRALTSAVSEDFFGVIPISARRALGAFEDGQLTKPEFWQSSGGAALLQIVLNHARKGRREDLDAADALIARFGNLQLTAEEEPASDAPMPTPKAEAPATGAFADACSRVVSILTDSAERFTPLLSQPTNDRNTAILGQCQNLIEEISHVLDPATDQKSRDLAEDVLEAQEMITLLGLEDDATSAADALALLAQLRQEAALKIAA